MLTGEHKDFKRWVRDFVKREIAPYAAEIDEKEELRRETINKMAEVGLLGLSIPKEYGGMADTLCYSIAVEEVSRTCASTGITLAAHISLGSYPIYLFANEEQKRKYLVPLARGEKIGAFGLTEPEAGSDAAALKTEAVLHGDEWVINGTKNFTTNGSIADTIVIAAVTDREKGSRGISSFIVEKDSPGFSPGKDEVKMGLRGSVTSELVFDDCRIPRENLLGEEGRGYKQMLIILDGGRISIGSMALGIAQGAFEESLEYSKERVQFHKPIREFQAIQWMLADMATEIEATRLLVYNASRLKDKGEPYVKQAAMCKLFASEVAMRTTTNAIQVHGGYGYMKERPLERFFRDAKLTEIGEGTSEIQRLVIAREILRNEVGRY